MDYIFSILVLKIVNPLILNQLMIIIQLLLIENQYIIDSFIHNPFTFILIIVSFSKIYISQDFVLVFILCLIDHIIVPFLIVRDLLNNH